MMRALAAGLGFVLLGCGQEGPMGPPGPPGAGGTAGTGGANGTGGASGSDGVAGMADGGAAADGGSSPPAPTSGTRIKTKKSVVTMTTTTSDGASSVVRYETSTWFDSLRNEPCAFQMASDGKTRCLPTLVLREVGGGNYFQDAGCGQPLYLTSKAPPSACAPAVTPAPPPPKYVATTPQGALCSGQSMRPLGPQIFPTGNIYIKSGASCVATAALTAYYDFFTSGGPEIPTTDFVESSTTTVTTE